MADVKKKVIALLNRVDGVDINLAAPTTTVLYVVPSGEQCIVTHVLFTPAAAGFTSCAAATDIDLGRTGATTDWADHATLAAMTTTELCIMLKSPETWENASPVYDAAEIFQMVVTTGAGAGSLVDVRVFGILSTP